jgi:hypothetical protein
MSGRKRALLTIAAFAWALPAGAQVPAATTTFDGKYVGVSRESSKTPAFPGAKCPPNGIPGPLTVRNGVIGTPGTAGWEGTVSPQGGLTVRNESAMRMDGQIDPQGNARAQYSGAGCIITYVWRKRSG